MRIRPQPLWLVPALLMAAWMAYLPGLDGTFLFDDFPNLAGLQTVRLHDADSYLRFLTSGTADPIGRPLSLLSFLGTAADWPNNPAAFLEVNIALHLLNGVLLFCALRRLGESMGEEAAAAWGALVGAGAWLLHPLFASTTLYVVQREAMLPATFILAGLLAYLHGRETYLASAGRSGLAWMVLGQILGTCLAALCKANGLLMPLLTLVLESTVLRAPEAASLPDAARVAFRRTVLAVVRIPAWGLLIFVGSYLLSWSQFLAGRPWSVGDRVLTQARVLVDYLDLLVRPRSVSAGLYNDGFQVSGGLLDPPSTAVALVTVLALLLGGWRFRRRWPAVSAAILFFLAGHVMESGPIPLELYFEHRNYVPALLFFWPLGLALARWNTRPWKPTLVALGVLAYLATTTALRADLWSDPQRMAAASVLANPESSRAQSAAAFAEMTHGKPAQALARLDSAWSSHPGDLQLGIAYVRIACSTSGVSDAVRARLADTLASTPSSPRFASTWLGNLLQLARNGKCPGVDASVIESWIEAAKLNPRAAATSTRDAEFGALEGMLAMDGGQPVLARARFDAALAARPLAAVATRQATLMGAAGYPREALGHLDFFESLPGQQSGRSGMPALHRAVLGRQGFWQSEIRALRQKLNHELATAPSSPDRGATP